MRERPWRLIQWKPRTSAALAVGASSVDSLESAAARYTPSVPNASPLREAEILLCAAAEVEHSLLVEYLYAAWSLDARNVRAKNVRDTVVSVAVQEMCHLITVQNLLLFIGSKPYFGRQDEMPHPDVDPFPFRRRPFSKSTLQEFLLAEMPPLEQMTPEQEAVMRPIADAHAGDDRFHQVGMLYARLFWLFQENDNPTEPWPAIAGLKFTKDCHIDSFAGPNTSTTFQADPGDESKLWHVSSDRDGVFNLIDSRQAALEALFEIASQGEGLQSAGDSHFSQFFDIYSQLTSAPPSILDVPTDPSLPNSPEGDPQMELNRITNKVAVSLCEVFDARYRIMLASLRSALSRDRTSVADAPVRAKYITWAMTEMTSFIKPLAAAITQLPRAEPASADQLAAPTFLLGGLDLPDEPAALDTLLKTLHASAEERIQAALQQPLPNVSIKALLQLMQTNDRSRFPSPQ